MREKFIPERGGKVKERACSALRAQKKRKTGIAAEKNLRFPGKHLKLLNFDGLPAERILKIVGLTRMKKRRERAAWNLFVKTRRRGNIAAGPVRGNRSPVLHETHKRIRERLIQHRLIRQEEERISGELPLQDLFRRDDRERDTAFRRSGPARTGRRR